MSFWKGYPISGLDAFDGRDDIMIFHAGTKFDENGQIVTNGGRVLGIVALDDDLDKAIKKVYANIDKVTFKDAFYRHDIGMK